MKKLFISIAALALAFSALASPVVVTPDSGDKQWLVASAIPLAKTSDATVGQFLAFYNTKDVQSSWNLPAGTNWRLPTVNEVASLNPNLFRKEGKFWVKSETGVHLACIKCLDSDHEEILLVREIE